RVHAARNQGGGHGAAQRKAAIHGQVGKTQQTEGNQDAQRDQAENQTDFQGAEQRKQGHGESGPARLVNAAGAALSMFSEKARRPAGRLAACYLTTSEADLSSSSDSVTPCFSAAPGLTNRRRLELVSDAMAPGFSPLRMRTTILPVCTPRS